ncbi:hypothetical protein [Erythrobacter sp. JK5]|uniref:hypothetical protein n=1 Tax=Erythrobacter sp. JK5 TaxID=2829500 RepID=UPI001BA93B9D|nr:hypothetical protein [Erythrobacter sp. JK5]QUL37919.1 hypothetical protein KDC96_00320 [Erythrobacter sp. JK5]
MDETSDFAARAHSGSGTGNWPDSRQWLDAMRSLLNLANRSVGASQSVGHILLRQIQRHRPANHEVRIVRSPATSFEVWTDGPIQTSTRPPRWTTYVTFSPHSARTQGIPLGPNDNGVSILVHELTHVYMNMNGVGGVQRRRDGSLSEVGAYGTSAYPNHNEFCATTVQNMHLSQHGVVLMDGYGDTADDPHIESTPAQTSRLSSMGRSAVTQFDRAGFLAANRVPLDFLRRRLPDFTRALGRLPIQFNPFAP